MYQCSCTLFLPPSLIPRRTSIVASGRQSGYVARCGGGGGSKGSTTTVGEAVAVWKGRMGKIEPRGGWFGRKGWGRRLWWREFRVISLMRNLAPRPIFHHDRSPFPSNRISIEMLPSERFHNCIHNCTTYNGFVRDNKFPV